MAEMMNIPIIGIVENKSYFECPDCGKKHYIFGESHIEEVAKQFHIEHIARLAIEPELAQLCDKGKIEEFQVDWLDKMFHVIEQFHN